MGNCFDKPPEAEKPLNSQPFSSGVTELPGKSGHCLAHSSAVLRHLEQNTQKGPPPSRTEGKIILSRNSKAFSLDELKHATRNFLPDSLLGEGGFGHVYKGWINKQTLGAARPESGMAVAVKKLKVQGCQGHKEWLSEVTYLTQLHHPNLVELIGYCLDGDNRLLVYEFMPKGSLEKHLFQRGAQPLSWETRIKIATDAARGLSFLHNSKEQVIYRDFKASNILLDSEFNAKLSDFGLAKAGPTGGNTHVSTQVVGTHGYAAPEYIATGQLSARCDVYSFGVVLLEIVSGRRALDKTRAAPEDKLVDWIKLYVGDKRKIFRIMDTELKGQYSRKGAYLAINIARLCINDAKSRPPMGEVLELLEKIKVSKFEAKDSQSHQGGVDSSPAHKTPSRHNYPSPVNRTSKGSPMLSHTKSPLRSPRKK